MKIKIISDGLSKNTRVINAETGETVENVLSIEWKCSVHSLATATLKFIEVPVEVSTITHIKKMKEKPK